MALGADAPLAVHGVCFPRGFRAGVASAQIRGDGDSSRLDVALLVSDKPAAAAGVFTRNMVRAAPVDVSEATVREGASVSAVIINAGNANACTGAQGIADTHAMAAQVATALDIAENAVLVCSTGVIGRPLPMDAVRSGIADAVRSLTVSDDLGAATAIMTTDTRPKRAVAEFSIGEHHYRVGGMAKGAGMIHPDMATLIVLLTTDAPVAASTLQTILTAAVDDTFNCVTVDGDTSTNDTALLLANGAAGGTEFTADSDAAMELETALLSVCHSLAEQVVADAEGAERYFRVTVEGAQSVADARVVARTVASSPLVKTAIHGADPNWGRIVAAVGRSGAPFELAASRVTIGDVVVFDRGTPTIADAAAVRHAFSAARVEIAVTVGRGSASGSAWGCELSAGYVRINADYTT